jgi:hypothetical protein
VVRGLPPLRNDKMKWFIIFMILLAIGVVCGVGCGLSLVAWKWLGWFGVVPIGLASTTVAGYAVWFGIGLLSDYLL